MRCNEGFQYLEDHAARCSSGLKVHLHKKVVRELSHAMEDTRAVVRTEAVVPRTEPSPTNFMGIWVFGIPGCQDLLVDVTIRSEFSVTRHGGPFLPGKDEQWEQ